MTEPSNVKYKNLGGDSGVDTCTIGEESIEVTFKIGGNYLYTFQATGRQNVEQMKRLARSGQGLNALTNNHVEHKCARRLGQAAVFCDRRSPLYALWRPAASAGGDCRQSKGAEDP